MVICREVGSEAQCRLRRRLRRLTGLTLGIAMVGTIGLSGTLAQDDDVAAADVAGGGQEESHPGRDLLPADPERNGRDQRDAGPHECEDKGHQQAHVSAGDRNQVIKA